MPTAEHSIDNLQFLCLVGSPQLRQEELEAFARGGVTGHGFRRLGVRGEPFSLVSIVDCADLADGMTRYETYLARVGAEPKALIKDGINWGGYVIQRVNLAEPGGLKAVANMAGGINPPSTALLTCRWVLWS